VHTDDVDTLWARALNCGATVVRELADAFRGEREGQFLDPYGYRCGVTQHIANVTQQELEAGVAAMFTTPPRDS
jgi:PhnB protein